jgi:hypothetical protein
MGNASKKGRLCTAAWGSPRQAADVTRLRACETSGASICLCTRRHMTPSGQRGLSRSTLSPPSGSTSAATR